MLRAEHVEFVGTRDRPVKADEVVLIMSAFKNDMPALVQLYNEQQWAAESFSARVKAIAEKSGLKPAVIRKVVKAKCDATLDDARHEAEQLSMALEEVGG